MNNRDQLAMLAIQALNNGLHWYATEFVYDRYDKNVKDGIHVTANHWIKVGSMYFIAKEVNTGEPKKTFAPLKWEMPKEIEDSEYEEKIIPLLNMIAQPVDWRDFWERFDESWVKK